MSLPLGGVTVLDLSRVLAGPFCAAWLADMGAEVIKIEDTAGGDEARTWPPQKGGESAAYLVCNRNKRGMTLDLKAPEGREVLKRLALPVILTPHPGEMARLIRQSVQDVQRDRERTAKEFAKLYHVIVVLKGYRTVVASFDGDTYINETGNPGMASGGTGDVLTGMIAGLLAQRCSLFDAARLGVYLHGLAGDLAAADRGQVGLTASDLLDRIPLAIRQYQSSQ